MSRMAVALFACLIAGCTGLDTTHMTTLPPLFVCGRAVPTLDSTLRGDPLNNARASPPTVPICRVPSAAYAVYAPLPPYPYSARLRGLEPTMLLRLRVTSDGAVSQATVLRSTGPVWLNRAVADTLRRWKLPSGTAQDVRIPIVYSLRCENTAVGGQSLKLGNRRSTAGMAAR
jgi:TonB family protein